jgi:hypothetical protein
MRSPVTRVAGAPAYRCRGPPHEAKCRWPASLCLLSHYATTFAFHSANTGDVRDSLRSRRACQQTHDAGATANGEELSGDTCDRVLDRGAATRDRYEPFIALSRRAIGDRRGHRRRRVELYATDLKQSLFHVWQMRIEEMTDRRLQVVRLSELSDPSPFPRLPRFLWRVG